MKVEAEGAAAGSAMGKALALLEAISNSAQGLNLTDAAAATGMPKQTAHRVLRQLLELDLLGRDPATDRYLCSQRMRRLSAAVLGSVGSDAYSRRLLQQLVDELHETCNIGVLDGTQVLYVDRVECDWPLRVQLQPGSRVPAHCTAIGKLLLAHVMPGRLRRLLDELPLQVFTPRTLRTPERLAQALQQIRQCGFAINEEEDSLGLNALAVPIRDPRGRVVAGLAVHAPLARMDLAAMVGKRERLERCAADIARNWFGPQ